jgi:Tol biopolymer transport system component
MLLVICAISMAQTPQSKRPPYDAPAKVMQPRIFALDKISTDLDESGGTFSPDGQDFYFTLLTPYTTNPHFGVICVSHFKNGGWQKPEVASFSGKSLDFAPRLSSDGSQLYFASIRPVPDSKRPRFRIWITHKEGGNWGDPVPLPAPINQEDSDNIDPAITASGDLYFASNRKDAGGHFHLYFSTFDAGKFQEPQKLGSAINSNFNEAAPAISPDGKLLVFASTAAPEDPERRRPEDLIAAGKPYPRQDLYVSTFRAGHWTPARHLEHGINSFAEEVYPSFSPDGKYLFWGSERSSFQIPTQPLQRAQVDELWSTPLNGRDNIYFISVDALEPNP